VKFPSHGASWSKLHPLGMHGRPPLKNDVLSLQLTRPIEPKLLLLVNKPLWYPMPLLSFFSGLELQLKNNYVEI